MVNYEVSGIYQITNLINGDFYIGQAKNVKRRFITHKSALNNKYHGNPKLQNAYNEYGADKFILIILAKCPIEYLTKLELWFIKNLNPDYNIGYDERVKTAKITNSTRDRTVPQERRDRIANTLRGRKLSLETREKQRQTLSNPILKLQIFNKRRKFTDNDLISAYKYRELGMSFSQISTIVKLSIMTIHRMLDKNRYVELKQKLKII